MSVTTVTRSAGEGTVTTTITLKEEKETVSLSAQKPQKKVNFEEGTVDNEFLNKKSSKKCCIYHKPKRFDESSSESEEDEKEPKKKKKDKECNHDHNHNEEHSETPPSDDFSDLSHPKDNS